MKKSEKKQEVIEALQEEFGPFEELKLLRKEMSILRFIFKGMGFELNLEEAIMTDKSSLYDFEILYDSEYCMGQSFEVRFQWLTGIDLEKEIPDGNIRKILERIRTLRQN